LIRFVALLSTVTAKPAVQHFAIRLELMPPTLAETTRISVDYVPNMFDFAKRSNPITFSPPERLLLLPFSSSLTDEGCKTADDIIGWIHRTEHTSSLMGFSR
jgi:hypothetical protein